MFEACRGRHPLPRSSSLQRHAGVAFSWASVVCLGSSSYSLDLVHLPVASVLNRLAPQLIGSDTPAWGGVALVALDALLVIGVAAACYYAVELPGRRMLRSSVRRLAGYPA